MDDSKEGTLPDALEGVIVLEEEDKTQPVKLNFEEAKKYISKKIEALKDDPNINPLVAVKNEVSQLEVECKSLAFKYLNLKSSFAALQRDQINFRRHIGEDTQPTCRSVGTYVDMEVQPEEIPSQIFQDWIKKIEKKNGPVECIDLSSDEESSVPAKASSSSSSPRKPSQPSYINHTQPPVPLPMSPVRGQSATDIPPKPLLGISADNKGITLQWRFPKGIKPMELTNYEIFGYQEKRNVLPSSSQWEKIGCVKAMTLPMSCTLTQFVEGSKYHFCVRALAGNKIGHFSDPASIILVSDSKKK